MPSARRDSVANLQSLAKPATNLGGILPGKATTKVKVKNVAPPKILSVGKGKSKGKPSAGISAVLGGASVPIP